MPGASRIPLLAPFRFGWFVMLDKAQIAKILDDCGTLLALKGENDFRCRAYHNAARAIEQYEGDFVGIIREFFAFFCRISVEHKL